MSTNFNTVPFAKYIGIPQAAATALCKASKQDPFGVPLFIDWNIPWQQFSNPTSCGVLIDLEGVTPNGAQLEAIRSVKIDNTFSECPIYITFPDTLDVITCPPQSVVVQPVNTNGRRMAVIAQNLVAGFIPQTRITVFNVQLPPLLDPAIQYTYPKWRGSVAIQRANLITPGFASPALGDQTVQTDITLQLANTVATILPVVAAGGFYYITSIVVNLIGIQAGGGGTFVTLFFESTGISGTLYNWLFWANPVAQVQGVLLLYGQSGLQLRLSALELWRLRNNAGISSGSAQIHVNFTYSLD